MTPPLLAPNGLADWSLDSALKRHVAAVVEYTDGDLEWAASEMGINRTTLYRWRTAWSEGRPARLNTKERGRRLALVGGRDA